MSRLEYSHCSCSKVKCKPVQLLPEEIGSRRHRTQTIPSTLGNTQWGAGRATPSTHGHWSHQASWMLKYSRFFLATDSWSFLNFWGLVGVNLMCLFENKQSVYLLLLLFQSWCPEVEKALASEQMTAFKSCITG